MAEPARPSIQLQAEAIASICDGCVQPGGLPVTFAGAAYDSREVQPGQLFVALRGARTDGHLHLQEAIDRNAAALLVERGHSALRALVAPVPVIAVSDTLAALGALAAWHRDHFTIPFVAVTGSNGKTTTKEMIAAALQTAYRVFKTPGNLNSRIGLPVALFDLTATHTAAVCELGMSTPGEIDALARIVRPRYAVFTNIAPAHLETLGSIDAVARAKFELLAHLERGGVTLFCADDPILAAKARALGAGALTYGLAAGADMRAEDLRVDREGTRFRIPTGEDVFLPLFGRHNVYNALAALLVARVLGVDSLAAVAALAVMEPAAHRSRILRAGPVTIIDDAYNANPQALEAALAALAEFPAAGRRVAVIGDMLELGAESRAFHRRIGSQAATRAFGLVVTVGRHALEVAAGARADGLPEDRLLHFEDSARCAAAVADWSRAGDTILIKGSRGVALEGVVAALAERYGQLNKEEA